MLGDPLVADLPKLIGARLPFPAYEEEDKQEREGSPADDERKPDGHT